MRSSGPKLTSTRGICKVRPFAIVDHDHVTKEVRGLLCDTCNRGLGLLGDSTERIRAALAYLERTTGT